jgi:hypothetical protein
MKFILSIIAGYVLTSLLFPHGRGWATTGEKKHVATGTHNVTLRNPQTGHEKTVTPQHADKYIKATEWMNRENACICKNFTMQGINCPESTMWCNLSMETTIF